MCRLCGSVAPKGSTAACQATPLTAACVISARVKSAIGVSSSANCRSFRHNVCDPQYIAYTRGCLPVLPDGPGRLVYRIPTSSGFVHRVKLAMALKSPRFAGNARLQAAANNSPTIKWGEQGEAVKILQQAYLDLGFAMPISTKKTGSPDGIFGNETFSVTKAFQSKHTLSPDGIVGKDTMAKLDELFAAAPPPPPPPPRPPRFEPVKKKDGFDHTANPNWQMVPVRGTKPIRLMNGDGLDVVSTLPSIVKVEEVPMCFVHGGREFILTGQLKGKAFIQARQGTKM